MTPQSSFLTPPQSFKVASSGIGGRPVFPDRKPGEGYWRLRAQFGEQWCPALIASETEAVLRG